MGANETNRQLFGKSEIDPNAATLGFNLGTKAGELSSQAGPVAFFNNVIQAVDKRRALEAQMKQEKLKAKVAQLQEIVLNDPDSPVSKKILADSNLSQLIGVDPSKVAPKDPKDALSSIFGGSSGGLDNVPPGTTLGVDTSIGKLNIPINREFTADEANIIAGSQSLDEVIAEINTALDGGIFSDDPIERTIQQKISDTQNPLWTSLSPDLQAFQSSLNALKKTLPFTEGGKQLTPFEAEKVFALLNVTGKNNDQIKKDIARALDIINKKGGLILSGQAGVGKKTKAEPLGTFKSSNGKTYTRFSDGSVQWQ